MLLSVLKFLQGFLQVTLTGSSPERFLNLCIRRNILIWNLCPNKEAGGFDFCISLKGFRASKELLKKTHTSVKIRKKCGLPFFLHRYRARKLFAAGILLCILLLWNCSKYVWKIEVNGTAELSQDMVLTWLEQKETSFGTPKTKVDCAAIEAALRSDFDVIAWTSVKLEGTKLTIDIQESLPEDEVQTLPSEGAWDIVAAEDAVVASIYTRQGTPQAEKGSVVSKGAVLISGRLDIMDDNGEVANYRYVVSDGDVTGTVTRTYQSSLARDYRKKVYTGEEDTSYTLQTGKIRIPLGKEKKNYSACETVVKDHQLQLLPNLYLPVHLYVTDRKAYVYRSATYTKAEAEALAKEDWNAFLEKFEQKGIPIIVKNVKIETDEKNCVIRGSIQAEVPIGRYAPTERITLPEQPQSDEPAE
ncbi:MAG: sporulation protein YqfD [Eubacterium sp.]|nr:sporulation protein YqfD [Eubacterium sp.]